MLFVVTAAGVRGLRVPLPTKRPKSPKPAPLPTFSPDKIADIAANQAANPEFHMDIFDGVDVSVENCSVSYVVHSNFR